MGLCRFCHEPAGFLRSTHQECEYRYRQAVTTIQDSFATSLQSGKDASSFCHGVQAIAKAASVPATEFEPLIIKGLGDLIERALDDHVLSEEEERRIGELSVAFDISVDKLEDAGLQQQLVKGAILRDLQNGNPQTRMQVRGTLPFLFQKSEILVWIFQNVDYHMMKERVRYVGGSSGASMRVAKGFYIRSGSFRGERISTQALELQDRGLVAITTKNIYFKGSAKGFRMALNKLISVERFEDGIGLLKDGANPKLQVLKVDDPWFAANLLAFL